MDERVFEDHLRRRSLVQPLLRIRLMVDVLHAQNRVGVPHILCNNRGAEDAGQLGRVGMVEGIALPIRERAIEMNLSFGRQTQNVLELGIDRVRLPVAVPVGCRTHVAALAAQQAPAALRRADDAVVGTERVEDAVIAANAAHRSFLSDIEGS